MKKEKFLSMMMTMLLMMVALVSCSDDDDDNGTPDAPAPQYAETAAKYNITTPNSEFESIEFTESGDYIIVRNTNYSGAKPNLKKNSLLKSAAKLEPKTRATDLTEETIITGKYTVEDGGLYRLDSIGTIKVTKGSDGAYYNFVFEGLDGKTTSFDAEKVENSSETSPKTLLVCRTWTIESVHEVITKISDGKVLSNITAAGSNMVDDYTAKWLNFLKENFPERYESEVKDRQEHPDEYGSNINSGYIIFTKAGTYMTLYNYTKGERSVDVMRWKWEDETNNIMKVTSYSEEEEQQAIKYGESEDDIWETLQLTFSGNNLVMGYTWYETEAEMSEDMSKDDTEPAYKNVIEYYYRR